MIIPYRIILILCYSLCTISYYMSIGGFSCDEMCLGKTVQLASTMLGNPKPRTLIIVVKTNKQIIS